LAALRALTAICSVNSHRNRCYDKLLEPGTAPNTICEAGIATQKF
jgi:hypothetical protein